jgi:hypothetical protein
MAESSDRLLGRLHELLGGEKLAEATQLLRVCLIFWRDFELVLITIRFAAREGT